MPLFALDIEKQFGNEYFSNRYILSGATLTGLVPTGLAITNIERFITSVRCTFTKYRIRDMTPDNDQFVVVQVNQPGQRGAGGTALLPLFDVARVDFSVGLGRPSRKFLRGVLQLADIGDTGELLTATIATINTGYVIPMLAVSEYVDVDGEAFTAATVARFASNRQLRRGSKRRTAPII